MKKFFKLGCLGFIGLIVLIIVIAVVGGGEDTPTNSSEKAANTTKEGNKEEPKEEPKEEAKKEDDGVSREFKSALTKAYTYAETMHMSKKGIYNQLISEHGEGFPEDAAQYAMDNIEFDWKANALKKAETYAETMSMSNSAIYEQLISEHGEQFTEEEAQYAVDNLE